ncbi:DUF4112 domain-containing protein [Halorubellus litoreus]|uniref:DUF4112 domain-containing protein n=1 Tax=Halorubellus litoreus TaxID=755308 RepID=A0ABD5VI62_9EURY
MNPAGGESRSDGRPTPGPDEEYCIACGAVIAVDAPNCPVCGDERGPARSESSASSSAAAGTAGGAGATAGGAAAATGGTGASGSAESALDATVEPTGSTGESANWSGAETGGGAGLNLGSSGRMMTGDSVGRLDALATTLDERWRIPIVGIKVGVDPLIGLIPGVGDTITLLISSYIVLKGILLGAPSRVLAKMTGALVVEALVGYVPVVGDAIDFLWGINVNNVERLKANREQLSGTPNYGFLVVGFFGPILLVLAVMGFAFMWLMSSLGGI